MQGKVAFLTGGGIAKTTARALAREAGESAERQIHEAGGIISFTKTLAAQCVQYGIRANGIGPGSVRTERTIARYDNKSDKPAVKPANSARARETIQKLYPFSKGEPDDIAVIVVFLASSESRMITGTTIAADGGRSSYLKVYAEE